MPDIKLLALDLDGTLLDANGEISEENRTAIREAEDTGVLVTIATGRRFRDARPVALDAELNAPMLTHNGALIKVAESLETVAYELLGPDVIKEILKIGKKYGGDALVSSDPHGKGTLFYDSISGDNVPLRRYVEWATRLHGDDAEESVHRVKDLFDVYRDLEVIHISFSGKCDPMERLAKRLKNEMNEEVNLLATVYPHLDFTLLDLIPHESSKAEGLKTLATIHGISASDVMAVGDNFNDLEMLEYAGTPVVMGNADSSLLKRKEFYTTLRNDQSGVAAAIKKHILGVANV
ncbi:MAG: HAD family phosphatase [Pyrinomonadaceae bacterium]|nr:HAD family phosphatase [Pyrinomonadaceae bacterium]